MECYCFARNKPTRREITKLQTATVISLWFWGLLVYPELYCDWPVYNQHSWNFSGVHGFLSLTVIIRLRKVKIIKKTIWLTGDEASIFPEVLTVFPDSVSERWNDNRAFSLTWPASMQIYGNKRKRLHKKRVQLPQDWHGRRFIVLEHQYGRRDVRWKRSIERFRITFTSNCTTWLSLPFSQGWQWSLFRHWDKFYDAMFIHQIYFGKFHFLIWEVVNLNLRFAVCPKRDSKFLW